MNLHVRVFILCFALWQADRPCLPSQTYWLEAAELRAAAKPALIQLLQRSYLFSLWGKSWSREILLEMRDKNSMWRLFLCSASILLTAQLYQPPGQGGHVAVIGSSGIHQSARLWLMPVTLQSPLCVFLVQTNTHTHKSRPPGCACCYWQGVRAEGGVLNARYVNMDTTSIGLTRRRNDLLVFVKASLFIWERSEAPSVAIVPATSISVPMGQGWNFLLKADVTTSMFDMMVRPTGPTECGWTVRVSAVLNNRPLRFARS